jgi:hypothetical protein
VGDLELVPTAASNDTFHEHLEVDKGDTVVAVAVAVDSVAAAAAAVAAGMAFADASVGRIEKTQLGRLETGRSEEHWAVQMADLLGEMRMDYGVLPDDDWLEAKGQGARVAG